jgi:protein-tyrosine phosphatase
MPRPRAGDWLADEMLSWRQQGMNTIVSLLEDPEVAELGLDTEACECEHAGLHFIRLPIADRSVPASQNEFSDLVADLNTKLKAGQGVGIHCRIGVGRAALLATCVLIALGLAEESAWAAVQTARGMPVPDTPEQRQWVARWAAKHESARLEDRR